MSADGDPPQASGKLPLRASLDALVIGGGFYGCEIALMLRRLGLARVALVEREPDLLRRASYVNQARVHHGYHYPRSLPTAERSQRNFARFVEEYRDCVLRPMTHLYAIAKGSRVSGGQFDRFCGTIGAPREPASAARWSLFDRALIDALFEVEEPAFDASKLAARLKSRLSQAGVGLNFGTEAKILGSSAEGIRVAVGHETLFAGAVFNCTYAHLDNVGVPLRARVKRETAEIVLIEPPRMLEGVGVTVMDGPFFSTMPFPALGLHSLTHVRYTPHESRTSAVTESAMAPRASHREAMLRDAARFLPALSRARVHGSLFEMKAVLERNEMDDGRPVLIEQCPDEPRIWSILGAKIDNIYDVFSFFESRDWTA